jgi:hypothetical protein
MITELLPNIMVALSIAVFEIQTTYLFLGFIFGFCHTAITTHVDE